jgi:hypothetical protein
MYSPLKGYAPLRGTGYLPLSPQVISLPQQQLINDFTEMKSLRPTPGERGLAAYECGPGEEAGGDSAAARGAQGDLARRVRHIPAGACLPCVRHTRMGGWTHSGRVLSTLGGCWTHAEIARGAQGDSPRRRQGQPRKPKPYHTTVGSAGYFDRKSGQNVRVLILSNS